MAVVARAESNLCEQHMVRAASLHSIPLGVLYAVGMTETGRKDSLQAYALNIAGHTVYAASPGDAVARFLAARGAGKSLIDLGCMQINYKFHGRNFDSVEQMLDPVANVEYAALFLKKLRAQEGSWTMAVARYHAGPHNNPAQKRYVCAVIKNLVASGFGGWTDRARSFCSMSARPTRLSAHRGSTIVADGSVRARSRISPLERSEMSRRAKVGP